MNKKNKFILILSLVSLILILAMLSFSQAINSKEEKVSEDVLEKFNQGEEKVKVIVNLNDKIIEKKLFGLLSSEKQVNKENLIEETKIQDNIKYNFLYSNSFSAELTQEEINLLIKKDEIQKIYIEPTFKLFLENSVNIINASSVWPIKINGENLTGKGQTICIIDSGINYNHPDLGGCYGENDPNSECKVIGGWDFCADDTVCNTEDSDPIDEHGHGTHVAGIAISSGGIKGVAPDAKVVMMKASNSTGGFPPGSNSIIKSIEWCIANATKFNISVISMSLGSGSLFNQYCDNLGTYPAMTNAINTAINKNISVVIATGNEGGLAEITYPACIQRTIKVGSTKKNPESISDFSNRWTLDMVVAPGSSITSTSINGGYAINSGTSMATPHVAGAVAIINQYFAGQGITKTPIEINNLLINTGKSIYDSFSERYYKRIDLYSATDEVFPQIDFTIGTEENDTSFQRNWIFVNISLIENNFKNITFNLYNQTKLVNSTNYNKKVLSINWTNLKEEIYYYNVTTYDNANNLNYTQTKKITIDNTPPRIILVSPKDNEIISNFEVDFIGNFSDLNLKNLTLYVWNSTDDLVNQTINDISGKNYQANILVNLTSTGHDTYSWNFYVCDFLDNCNFATTNSTFILSEVDLILISPEDNNSTRSKDITFVCNATSSGANLKNISLNIWNKTTNELIDDALRNLDGLDLIETQQSFERELLSDGEFIWGCMVYNDNGFFNSKNYSISHYTIAPNLRITFESLTKNSVTIKLISPREINYTLVGSENSIENSTFSKIHSIKISNLIPNTTYSFDVIYCDNLNNCNTIEGNNFKTLEELIEPENPPSSGGKNPKESSSNNLPTLNKSIIYYGTFEKPINSTQLINGYTTEIKENISIYFQNSLNQKHVINLNQKNNSSAIFTIQSEPVLVEIKINETKLISLNSPYFYDLQIRLLELYPTVKINLKEIYYPTNYVETPNTNNSVYLDDLVKIEEEQDMPKIIIFSIITIIFLIIIIFLIKSLISKNEE